MPGILGKAPTENKFTEANRKNKFAQKTYHTLEKIIYKPFFFCILKVILEDMVLIYKNRMPRERNSEMKCMFRLKGLTE